MRSENFKLAKIIEYDYFLLSVLLWSSGYSGVTPWFPLDSNGILNGETNLNQMEIQVWLLNLHLITGGQTEESKHKD